MNPMEQLKDIHLAESIGLWPLAYGWWLLIALTLLLTGLCIWLFIRYRRLGLARRQALSALQTIQSDDGDWPQQLNSLLKRLAISYYPRREVAALHSASWVTFLSGQVPATKASSFNQIMTQLQDNLYHPSDRCDFEQARTQAEVWIRHAKPHKGGSHV